MGSVLVIDYGQITGPPRPSSLERSTQLASQSPWVREPAGCGSARCLWISVPQAAVKTLTGAEQSPASSAGTVGSASGLPHVLTGGTRGFTGCRTGLGLPGPLARSLPRCSIHRAAYDMAADFPESKRPRASALRRKPVLLWPRLGSDIPSHCHILLFSFFKK